MARANLQSIGGAVTVRWPAAEKVLTGRAQRRLDGPLDEVQDSRHDRLQWWLRRGGASADLRQPSEPPEHEHRDGQELPETVASSTFDLPRREDINRRAFRTA